jgi:hypothetical protein
MNYFAMPAFNPDEKAVLRRVSGEFTAGRHSKKCTILGSHVVISVRKI